MAKGGAQRRLADLKKFADEYVDLAPNSYLAYYHRSIWVSSTGIDAAARDIHHGNKLNPNDANMLAHTFAVQGKYDEAKMAAAKAIRLNPKGRALGGGAYHALAVVAFFEHDDAF